MSSADWIRLDRENRGCKPPKFPCPVCGHGSWCMVRLGEGHRPAAVICGRVSDGCVRDLGEAGYLHVMDGLRHALPALTPRAAMPTPGRIDAPALAEGYAARLSPALLAAEALALGVSVASLRALGIGWDRGCWTFPMHDAAGVVVGIRIRSSSGRKWAVPGSHAGVFLPDDFDTSARDVMVEEGPTDAAAGHDLAKASGWQVIGRPSCRGCHKEVVAWTTGKDVAVMAHNDGPNYTPGGPGMEGASDLCGALWGRARSVRLLWPPSGIKDLREWKRRGLTSEGLKAAAMSRQPWRPTAHSGPGSTSKPASTTP